MGKVSILSDFNSHKGLNTIISGRILKLFLKPLHTNKSKKENTYLLQVLIETMIKRIRKEFRKHFKLVKKFSDRIEADLAREVLGAYHINSYLFKSYFGQMTALFVPANEYNRAMRVLYAD